MQSSRSPYQQGLRLAAKEVDHENVALWIVQILLVLAFLIAGGMKLSQPSPQRATERWGDRRYEAPSKGKVAHAWYDMAVGVKCKGDRSVA